MDSVDGVLAEEAGGAPVSDEGVACVSSGWILSEISSPALSSSRSRPNVFAPLPTIGGGQGRDLLDLVVAQHARRANEPALGLSFLQLFSRVGKSQKNERVRVSLAKEPALGFEVFAALSSGMKSKEKRVRVRLAHIHLLKEPLVKKSWRRGYSRVQQRERFPKLQVALDDAGPRRLKPLCARCCPLRPMTRRSPSQHHTWHRSYMKPVIKKYTTAYKLYQSYCLDTPIYKLLHKCYIN